MSLADIELVFSHIQERDVDLLLVEELRSSKAFRRWILRQAIPDLDADQANQCRLVKVLQSVSGNLKVTGESDILVLFDVSTRDAISRVLLLIENKIDAQFQESQPERYQKRAQGFIAANDCHQAVCVLVAPDEYLETSQESEGFDARISYEEIIEFLSSQVSNADAETAERLRHRQEVLDHAINKYRRGWVAQPSESTTQVWKTYHEEACALAPTPRIPAPGKKPASSGFVRFPRAIHQLDGLPKCTLIHKLRHGNVDQQIAGWASYLERLKSAVDPLLEDDLKLRRAANSLAINIQVPLMDLSASSVPQQDQMRQGLRAALRLQSWYERCGSEFAKCALPILGRRE